LSNSLLHVQRWIPAPVSIFRFRNGVAVICPKTTLGAVGICSKFPDSNARVDRWRTSVAECLADLATKLGHRVDIKNALTHFFRQLAQKKIQRGVEVKPNAMPSSGARAYRSLSLAFAAMLAAVSVAWAAEPGSSSTPIEISPEGVQALLGTSQPFLLADAEQPGGVKAGGSAQTRVIYYTQGPSFRAAQVRAVQDRSTASGANQNAVKFASQRLIGTPLDWRRLGLKFSLDPVPAKALELTPRQLSEALKDGADLQIVDLRPTSDPAVPVTPFTPEALRLMPHQVEAELPKLSKQRWLVFVDGGDGIGASIAQASFHHGYPLATSLKGGYPAWTAATDR